MCNRNITSLPIVRWFAIWPWQIKRIEVSYIKNQSYRNSQLEQGRISQETNENSKLNIADKNQNLGQNELNSLKQFL